MVDRDTTLIDFHNHVLPDVDDGPQTLEQSMNMLRAAAQQGITDVVNTVHLQHPKTDHRLVENKRLKTKVKNLQKELAKEGIEINIHLGAEVFYLPNLLELVEHPLCTFGNGKYMLVEFPFHQLPEGYDNVLFNLVMAGVTPIVAHPERYRTVQGHPGLIRRLIRAGCLIQVDGGSIVGVLGNGSQKTAVQLVQEGLCHLIGSDAHDDQKRNFCLQEAVAICRDLIGERILDLVTTRPKMVLAGEPIVPEEPAYREVRRTLFQRIMRRFEYRYYH